MADAAAAAAALVQSVGENWLEKVVLQSVRIAAILSSAQVILGETQWRAQVQMVP